MNKQQNFIIIVLALLALSFYLFLSAPEKLPDNTESQGENLIPVERVLRILASENDIARSLYTGEIVGNGLKSGIAFKENWKEEGVDAGPLPALFLRETSSSLKNGGSNLGLFLGSDFPIEVSNLFSDEQMENFEKIKQTKDAVVFKDPYTNLNTAMFPDYASVMACVTCHNEHKDSPKKDWVLNDIMGATTWTFSKDFLTYEESLYLIESLRQGFADAYTAFLEKSSTFENPPVIGDKWPSQGYFLPSAEVFFAEFSKRASPITFQALLEEE